MLKNDDKCPDRDKNNVYIVYLNGLLYV